MKKIIIGDLPLAQVLERAAAEDDAAYVRSMGKLRAGGTFDNLEFENGVACFAGRSPYTAVHGFGTVPGRHGEELLRRIESFYEERSFPTTLAVPSVVEPETAKLLRERGYGTLAYRNVYIHHERVEAPKSPRVSVREVASSEDLKIWVQTVAEGFAGRALESPDDISLGQASKEGNRFFLGYFEGKPAAASALYVNGKVARLAGMGTLAQYRGCGLQSAMIEKRVDLALELGASQIFSDTQPGNNSQRNLERFGFKLAYVRSILRKDP